MVETPHDQLETESVHPVPVKIMERYPHSRLVKVNGTSMDRVLPEGSLALVDFGSTVEAGDIAVVCTDGHNGTIKHIKLLANGIELLPDSTDPTHESEIHKCRDEDCSNIEIRGKVIWYAVPFDFIVPF